MDRSFLLRDTVEAAERLIGCLLVRKTEQGTIRVRITETEAYKGKEDPASHAFRGMTHRNRHMFGEVGVLYVYLIYGMHYCMNIAAHEPGEAGAVLIRAAEPVEGIGWIRANRPGVPDRSLMDGPGKLAKSLGIDISFDGTDLFQPLSEITIERGDGPPVSIRRTPRIGISRATEKLWRFVAEAADNKQAQS